MSNKGIENIVENVSNALRESLKPFLNDLESNANIGGNIYFFRIYLKRVIITRGRLAYMACVIISIGGKNGAIY